METNVSTSPQPSTSAMPSTSTAPESESSSVQDVGDSPLRVFRLIRSTPETLIRGTQTNLPSSEASTSTADNANETSAETSTAAASVPRSPPPPPENPRKVVRVIAKHSFWLNVCFFFKEIAYIISKNGYIATFYKQDASTRFWCENEDKVYTKEEVKGVFSTKNV